MLSYFEQKLTQSLESIKSDCWRSLEMSDIIFCNSQDRTNDRANKFKQDLSESRQLAFKTSSNKNI